MRFTHAMQKRGCLFYLGLGAALAFLLLLTLASLVLFAPGTVLAAVRLLPSGHGGSGSITPSTITVPPPGAHGRTPVRAPNTTPAPAATPALAVSAAQRDFAAELIAPLAAEAQRRRSLTAQADPADYTRRIDSTLNTHRINFLVAGYGVTLERPYPPTYKGHLTLYSLDLRTLQIAAITLNHDIRAPEVERFHAKAGQPAPPSRLDRAYLEGGFALARQTVEDATGLNVDFQLTFEDSVVKNLVDDVFNGLVVVVPFTFDSEPIVFGDQQYPALRFAEGRQKLTGLQALQFIKGIDLDLDQGISDRRKEPAARKQIVVGAVLDAVKREAANPLFWTRMLAFLRRTLDSKEVVYDFDAASLLFQTIARYITRGGRVEKIPFNFSQSLFIVDTSVGDGGVQWLSTSQNPIMLRELANGFYPDPNMAVPTGLSANPDAEDLPAAYWTPVRELIGQRLAH